MTYLPANVFGSRGHELKLGYRVWIETAAVNNTSFASGNYILVYDRVGGTPDRPVEIRTFNYPVTQTNRHNAYGVYANDRWEISRRLTLNLGLRWDVDTSWVPEQTKEQGQFLNAGTYPRVDANEWRVFAPRAGMALDLTGDGKTVLKTTYGWYNDEMADNAANPFNKNSAATATYRWRDQDGNNDYTPGEVNLDLNGPDFLSITAATNNIFNADLRAPHTHEISAQVDRELRANMAGRVIWVYRKVVNQIATVNILRPYTAYNIPITRRDPGSDGVLNTADDGGRVTIWDYDAAFRGAAFVGNQQQNAPRNEQYQTVEFSIQKRMAGKWGAFMSYAATVNNEWLSNCGPSSNASCAIPQTPNDEFFPKNKTVEHVFKINGNYQLPYGFQIAGLMEYQPGLFGQRTNIFRAADPDGGTPLRQLSTVTLRLEEFGSQQNTVRHSSNIRVSKFMKLPKGRLQLDFDVFNLTNEGSVWAAGYVSGPTFGYVSRILSPRVVQFGASYEF